jgi:hypothetical protein
MFSAAKTSELNSSGSGWSLLPDLLFWAKKHQKSLPFFTFPIAIFLIFFWLSWSDPG